MVKNMYNTFCVFTQSYTWVVAVAQSRNQCVDTVGEGLIRGVIMRWPKSELICGGLCTRGEIRYF